MRVISAWHIGLAAACAACQILLPDMEPAPATAPADASAASDAGAMSVADAPASKGPPCGLRPDVIREDLPGAPSLLVSDDEGAYFIEGAGTDDGTRIASLAALRDGGLAVQSIATTPGDNLTLLWPDPSTPGRLWYVANNPGGNFFRPMDKSLAAVDPAFIGAPGPIIRYHAAQRLLVVMAAPSSGITVSALTPNAGLDQFAELPTVPPSAVLGVTGDTDAFVASTSAIIKVVHGASSDDLYQAADGGVSPQGPIAVRAGVVYFLARDDVWSVNANGGSAAPLGANMNAHALASDDHCVYFATDAALMAIENDGGAPRVVAELGTKLFELSASAAGVFWTTAGVAPRAFAMLRPIPQ